MSGFTPTRRIRNEFELDDLIRQSGSDRRLIEQDFVLMTVAAGLAGSYGDRLYFKGGFVLRHAHGHRRFSRDIDATRVNPPRNKLDSADVAEVIRNAGLPNLLTLRPGEPATDSGRTLVQRTRPTDLADLAMILEADQTDDTRVRGLAVEKFKLVKQGDNLARIERNIETMAAEYDAAIRAVAPDAPDFATASAAVRRRLTGLLP